MTAVSISDRMRRLIEAGRKLAEKRRQKRLEDEERADVVELVERVAPYLVSIQGGKAPEQAPAARSIKDYPLAVRFRAREIVKERWDRQSQQPPEQAPDPYLQKLLPVRKKARELARQKLDRKYPPKQPGK